MAEARNMGGPTERTARARPGGGQLEHNYAHSSGDLATKNQESGCRVTITATANSEALEVPYGSAEPTRKATLDVRARYPHTDIRRESIRRCEYPAFVLAAGDEVFAESIGRICPVRRALERTCSQHFGQSVSAANSGAETTHHITARPFAASSRRPRSVTNDGLASARLD